MPNVKKSKMELKRPNRIMNFLMNPRFHFFGSSTQSSSTLSVGIAIAGKSLIKFDARICLGSNGKKGRKSENAAILMIFPKLALVLIKMYFIT
jgi:hypothetical protein